MATASLGTILVDGNASSPRNWSSQDYATIDESVANTNDSDFIQAPNATNNVDTSFTLQNVPSNFGTMTSTCTYNIRAKVTSIPGSRPDTFGLRIRLVDVSQEVTLAAGASDGTFHNVVTNIGTTSFTNYSGTFTYVNTGVGPTNWNSAQLEVRQTWNASGGADTAAVAVASFDLGGTYTILNQTASPSLLTNSNTLYTPTATPGAVSRTPSLLTNTSTVYTPTVSGSISRTPSLLTNTSTVYEPTVSSSISRTPDLLTNTSTVYTPTATPGAVSRTPDLLTNTSTVYEPTAELSGEAQTAYPDLLTNTSTVYAPTATPGAVSRTPDLLTNTSTVYEPTVSSSISRTPDLLTNTSTVYAPTATPGAVSRTPDLLTNTSTVYEPTATPGAVSRTPDLLTNTSTVYEPEATVEGLTYLDSLGSAATAKVLSRAAATSAATSTAIARGGAATSAGTSTASATTSAAALSAGTSTGVALALASALSRDAANAAPRLAASAYADSAGQATATGTTGALANSLNAAATVEVFRSNVLRALEATATARAVPSLWARSLPGSSNVALTSGAVAQSVGTSTASTDALCAARSAGVCHAAKAHPTSWAASAGASTAELGSIYSVCAGRATALLRSQAACVSAGTSGSAAGASGWAVSGGLATVRAIPTPDLLAAGTAYALLPAWPSARAGGSSSAIGHMIAGGTGFLVYGATNTTPGTPIGTLEYKLDYGNYGYALSSLMWNGFQYIQDGAGRLSLRYLGDVYSDAYDVPLKYAQFGEQIKTWTDAGVGSPTVKQWLRTVVGRPELPLPHANTVYTHWISTVAKVSSGANVPGHPQSPSGESKAPHARFEVPDFTLVHDLGEVMYLYDAEYQVANIRTGVIEDLPRMGGPILSRADGVYAIGIYTDTSNWHTNAFGYAKKQVKWLANASFASVALCWEQEDGIPMDIGPKFGDFWLVVGTLEDVEDTFIRIRDTLESAKRQKVQVSGVSTVELGAIEL